MPISVNQSIAVSVPLQKPLTGPSDPLIMIDCPCREKWLQSTPTVLVALMIETSQILIPDFSIGFGSAKSIQVVPGFVDFCIADFFQFRTFLVFFY